MSGNFSGVCENTTREPVNHVGGQLCLGQKAGTQDASTRRMATGATAPWAFRVARALLSSIHEARGQTWQSLLKLLPKSCGPSRAGRLSPRLQHNLCCPTVALLPDGTGAACLVGVRPHVHQGSDPICSRQPTRGPLAGG